MKKIFSKSLLFTFIAGLVLVTGCLFVFKIHEADTLAKVLTSFCNSMFIVGGLLMFFGLLIWCTNHGAFVGLQYGFKRIFEKRRFQAAFEARQSYSEYRESKMAKHRPYADYIIVGVFFIIISIVIYFFI